MKSFIVSEGNDMTYQDIIDIEMRCREERAKALESLLINSSIVQFVVHTFSKGKLPPITRERYCRDSTFTLSGSHAEGDA